MLGSLFDDRYEIISLLGSGGVGDVYLAREVGLDRQVALKLLHPLIENEPQARARFEREAGIMSALQHKNIVAFLRFGIASLRPYMVMEYVQGKTLRQLINAGPIPWRRALGLGAQLCDALSYAHAASILHRDIKPDNILVIDDAGQDQIKIMDFGLAGLLQICQVPSQKLTQTGCLVGSLHYVSPEQALGQKPDVRSDIYALGCVLYEAISGLPPFAADNPVDLLQMHVNELPRALSTARPTSDLPRHLDDLLATTMAKKPENRYQSMADLKIDLDQLLTDSPVRGTSRSTSATALPRTTRNSIVIATVIVALSSLAIYVAVPHLVIALLAAQLQSEQFERASQWSARLRDLGHRDGATLLVRHLEKEAQLHHDLLALAQAQLILSQFLSPQDRAESAQAAAQALATLGKYAAGAPDQISPQELSCALRLSQAVQADSPALGFEAVDTLQSLATRYRRAPAVSLAFAQTAWHLSQRILMPPDVRRGIQECKLAIILADQGNKTEAEKHLRSASQVMSRLRLPLDKSLLDLYLIAGWTKVGTKPIDVLNHFLSVLPDKSLPWWQHDLPLKPCFQLLGQDEALETSTFRKHNLPKSHPQFAKEYADYLFRQNQINRASAVCQDVLKSAGIPPSTRAYAALELALCWDVKDNWPEMLKAADLAVSLCRQNNLAADITVQSLSLQGLAQGSQGNDKQAELSFQSALALLPPELPYLRREVLGTMITWHCRRHQWSAARQTAQSVLELAQSDHIADQALLAERFIALAYAQLRAHDPHAAEHSIARAIDHSSKIEPALHRLRLRKFFCWYSVLNNLPRAQDLAAATLKLSIDKQLGDQSICEDTVLVADNLIRQRRFRDAAHCLENLWRQHKSALIVGHALLPALGYRRLTLLADSHSTKEQWQEQEQCAQSGLAAARSRNASKDVVAQILVELSLSQQEQGKAKPAEENLKAAMKIASIDVNFQRLLQSQCNSNAIARPDPTCQDRLKQAVAFDEQEHVRPRSTITDIVRLAQVLTAAGHLTEARTLLKNALARYQFLQEELAETDIQCLVQALSAARQVRQAQVLIDMAGQPSGDRTTDGLVITGLENLCRQFAGEPAKSTTHP